MSLPSENKKSGSLSMTDLVQRNAQALDIIDLIPYQPTVYAIPEQWLEKEMQLLADAVQFQPMLYRLIANLATREEYNQLQESQKTLICQLLGNHIREMERLSRQDGKERDKFSTDLSRKLSESLRDLDNAKENLERTCRKWVLITAAVSVVSSALACVLCLLLAG